MSSNRSLFGYSCQSQHNLSTIVSNFETRWICHGLVTQRRRLHFCVYIVEDILNNTTFFLSILNPRCYLQSYIPTTVQVRVRVSNRTSQNVDFGMAEQEQIPVLAPGYPHSFVDKERCDSQPSPTNSTFPFLKLPKEFQYQIYEWAVGNRTLHVQHSLVWPEHEMPSRNGHVYCYVCHAQSSQFDVYDSYAKPVIFEDKLGSTPGFDFDPGCRCLFSERARYSMDLRLLTASSETAREAQRLFYSATRGT